MLRETENLSQRSDILGRGLGLAVENGSNGDFFAAKSLGEGFEGDVLLLLRGEEERGLGGKAVDDVLLCRESYQLGQL